MHFILTTMCCGILQAAPVDGITSSQETEGVIDAVTLYNGYAEVERVAKLELSVGVHDLIFNDITDKANFDSMRASASDGWTVLMVATEVRRVPRGGKGRVATIEAKIRELEVKSNVLEFQRKGIEEDLSFVRSIGVRTSADASEEGGTTSLDIDVVKSQLAYVQETRNVLMLEMVNVLGKLREVALELSAARADLAAYGGQVDTLRLAKVRLAVVEAGEGEVRLLYGVEAASWEPAYSIRLTDGMPTIGMQYDGLVNQATGEDWENVQLTFSTAEPTEPSGPAEINPVFVDVFTPPPPAQVRRANSDVGYALGAPGPEATGLGAEGKASKRAENAYVRTGGTSVTYGIPGRVSVNSDGSASRRIRIAEFDAPATLFHVARPLAEEKVYLRSDVENTSPFVLLGGEASLFMEGDYIGPSWLKEVGPGGTAEVWWGADPSVSVERLLLERTTSKTGLFGGGIQTTSAYRIDLENTLAKPLTLEVWDRQPVSRNSDIEVRIADVSPGLAADKEYVETAKEQGLLKWVLTLDPKGSPGAEASISWLLRVSHSSKVKTTPIPD